MRKLIEVLRRASANEEPYLQTFSYTTDDATATLATALRELNARDNLRDVEGAAAKPIQWDCGCLQRKCGACAMVVNGVPRLACDTRLAELKGERVRVEPLRKFPVVADLMVDRSVLLQNLLDTRVWLESDASLPNRRWSIAFEASRCLQCGLCLEVCPNFSVQGAFGGMAAMVPLSRLLSEAPVEQRRELAASYRDAVYGGCGKSLACRNVCPAHIDMDKLLARSAAAAVWHRW